MRELVTENFQIDEWLSTLINAIPDLILLKDGMGRWLKANEYTLQLYGVSNEVYFYKSDLEIAALCPLFLDSFQACIESDQEAWETRGRVRKLEKMPRGDQLIILDITKVPLFHEDGSRKGLLVVGRDITEQKRTENELHYIAGHDQLTNLPNRRSFQQEIQATLLECKENRDTFALLYLDVDRFKNVNDTLGHTVGDMILKQVSHRLSLSLPPHRVYRIGGDEFTILLPRATRAAAVNVAQTIHQQFEQPYQVEEHSFFLKASIGISLYPFDGSDMDTIVAHADTAMYQAKRSRYGFEFYQNEMDQMLSRALILEKELRKAVQHQTLDVYYQPKISFVNGNVVGMEALVRWHHPSLGKISPAEFIPLAEETGLIWPITEWVLNKSCHFLKELKEKGFTHLHMSVNLSPSLFQQEELLERIADIVYHAGIGSRSLELEVTESVMKDHQQALKTLNRMKALGLRVAVDDFGTGYSSLNYLIQFPIDTLKIDQSFIRNIDKKEYAAIVKTIIDMANNLNLNVIAEGIETKEQEDFLRQHDCLEGQGYYYSHPLPPEDILTWLYQHD